jgi:23S rRNA (adenine2503-C2)-methyltransferase
MKINAWGLTHENWKAEFAHLNINSGVLNYWLQGLYGSKETWSSHVSLKQLSLLEEKFDLSLPTLARTDISNDGTIKFLVKFSDNQQVEAVLIPFFKRYTMCLSTQVGCAMNCSFCFTGTQGLRRQLSAGEIIGQYLTIWNWLKQHSPKSLKPAIVFMGQGEPFHNVEQVLQATKIFTDRNLIGIGHRQMTISTAGYLPGLKLFKHFPKINLALSLHSPFNFERDKLIPINKQWPLEILFKELDQVNLLKRQFITYEYLMIKDFNLSDEHVEALSLLLSHRKALINLIPFNPFPGSNWQRPENFEIEEFKEKLVQKKLRVMVRQTKGDEILAACGQLKVLEMSRRLNA